MFSLRSALALPVHVLEYVVLLSTLTTPVLGAQPSAPSPIPGPLRELPWGQLNFLHTTDIHGWLSGHLREYVSSLDAYP